ncbi:hypothetical protein C1645_823718 [Glomus cerebriforme]|uniref:Uncharacterized protein n=1 Tax=Glomus cerebriforme TaxID=658196 RepID=A0A397SZS8_9GLOM|nr:hypothetical protein C1645_823718 [Glomus cerebriforme]
MLWNNFRLYWRRNLINSKIRDTIKKTNKFKYIGEWLTLKVNKEIVKNMDKKEIDWEKTLYYIMNKEEGGKEITSEKDSRNRTYNIKNLIEKLPTYIEMETRNTEIYNSRCPRCRWDIENWTHIWNCNKNEITIYEIITSKRIEKRKH